MINMVQHMVIRCNNAYFSDFQSGKIRALFAHPQSAGHGLTLTKGTTTIWTSPTYNAEHYKQFNHRIYLDDGVYGELALVHSRGQFVRLPWTCPDYYHDEAIEFFTRVRESFEFVAEAQSA